jgi:chromosomal replication initiator protein
LTAHADTTAPSDKLRAVWDEVLGCLRATLNAATYNLAFSNTRALRLDDDRIVLAVETEFARSWVAQRYQAVLKDALFEVLGTDLTVEVTVAPAHPAAAEPPAAAPAPAPTVDDTPVTVAPGAGRVHGRLQERFQFETFVTGPSNRFAHAAALAVAEQPAQAFNPFFLYGGVGLGKTHLLQAIGHFVARNHPALTVRYVSVETFTNDFISALGDGGIRAFKERYRGVDVLLIDDIQMLEGKDQTQEEFFHTFNDLHDAGKQIVISSDRPPKAIATLESRLRSRFEMGLITDVQPPDLETRIAILRRKVSEGGYKISDPNVLEYIASRLQDNVRELEGALIRVVAQASHAKSPVTVDLAREVLRAYLPNDGGAVTVETIQEEVCRHYGISIAELVGDKRDKRVVVPRQVAMYLARELTQSSLPALGRAFGGRDHTTVMYAVNKVGRQMSDEGEIFSAVQNLTHRLKNAPIA